MRLVIDTNCIIAALLRAGGARRIINENTDGFCTPEQVIHTLKKHKEDLCKKADITEEEFYEALGAFQGLIDLATFDEYAPYLPTARDAFDHIDPEDTPFLALALATELDIWSDDKHFQRQDIVRIWTTTQLINHLGIA